jgi:pilus assembly protein CpaB
MNRNRLLLIGIIALLIAGVVSLRLLGMIRHSMAADTQSSPVVVVAKDVNVGQQLTDADLRVASMPVADLPEGTFRTVAELAGRGVILPMQANEIVLASKLASPEAGAGLPSMITPGLRAVSVKVNDVVSVAGFVVAGTHVDVIVTGTPHGNGQDATTTTVLQDVPVLAAGKKLQRDSQGQPQDVPVITLLVSPSDAQLLTLASSEGKIQLALRNPTDVTKQTTSAVRNAAIYAGKAAEPKKAKTKVVYVPKAGEMKEPVTNAYNIEVIRGDKREVTKF